MNEENILIQQFHQCITKNENPNEYIYRIDEEFPNSVILNYYIGHYFKNSGRIDEAKERFYKCIKLNTLFSQSYFELNDLVEFEDIEPYLKMIFNKKTLNNKSERVFILNEQLRIGSILGPGYTKDGKFKEAKKIYKTLIPYLSNKNDLTELQLQCWKNICLSMGKLFINSEPDESIKYYKLGLSKKSILDKNTVMIPNTNSFKLREIDKDLINGYYLAISYSCKFNDLIDIDNYFDTWRNYIKNDDNNNVVIRDLSNYKIKIGYISPDFNKNAVGLFLTPLLKYFNKDKFEVYCYNNNFNTDEFSDVFFDYDNINWYNIANMNVQGVYNLIDMHNLDILIDLIGHGPKNRMEVLAMNPVKKGVIINYLGYPSSTNLKEITYRIVDNITDTDESRQEVSEHLIKLPNCFVCYHLFENVKMPKIDVINYSDNKIRIGIMNKSSKCSDFILKIWKKILDKKKNIILFIKLDQNNKEQHKKLFYNFPKKQIEFFDFCEDLPSYFNLFNKIDVCIDTYPYSGTTTTCSSLLMGVPVFTIYNKKNPHVSNVTASILKNTDLNHFVCRNIKEYIGKILNMTNENKPDFYYHSSNSYREIVREKFLNSMDPVKFMKDYEDALEKIVIL